MTAYIKFNKQQFALPRGEHTGDNLRAFFGVKKSHDLYVEMDEGDDVLLEGDTKVFIDHGDRF